MTNKNLNGYNPSIRLPTANDNRETWCRLLADRFGTSEALWINFVDRVHPGPIGSPPCGHHEGIWSDKWPTPVDCPECIRRRIFGRAKLALRLIRKYLTPEECRSEYRAGCLTKNIIRNPNQSYKGPKYLIKQAPLLTMRMTICFYCGNILEQCTCVPCKIQGCLEISAYRNLCKNHARMQEICPECGEECEPYPCNYCNESIGCGCCQCKPSHNGFRYIHNELKYHNNFDKSLPERYIGIELELSKYDGDVNICQKWGISAVSDSSIISGPNGNVELRLAPARGIAVKMQLEDILHPNYNAQTNISCGCHTHVDARNLTCDELWHVLALWASIECGVYQLVPPHRWENTCCKPLHLSWDEIKNRREKKYRYYGLNLWEAYKKHKTIEFRLWPSTLIIPEILLYAQISDIIVCTAIKMSWEKLYDLYKSSMINNTQTSWNILMDILPIELRNLAKKLRQKYIEKYSFDRYKYLDIFHTLDMKSEFYNSTSL